MTLQDCVAGAIENRIGVRRCQRQPCTVLDPSAARFHSRNHGLLGVVSDFAADMPIEPRGVALRPDDPCGDLADELMKTDVGYIAADNDGIVFSVRITRG